MGLQLLQLEFRLGKNPSRSFRPLKSAENSWKIWISCSLRVPFALDWSWSNIVRHAAYLKKVSSYKKQVGAYVFGESLLLHDLLNALLNDIIRLSMKMQTSQYVETPIRKSARISRGHEIFDFHVNAEEHELEDLSESSNYRTSNYRDTLSDLESDEWLKIIHVEM
ncbi:hypothetical protein Tco_1069652 [Tanacetum coccineum]|uniref:Uncharacterized protein n=1 Tax=Tanacetum coccineum TaxID=301880 RepID=A0ABQ5HJ39_9ASTR